MSTAVTTVFRQRIPAAFLVLLCAVLQAGCARDGYDMMPVLPKPLLSQRLKAVVPETKVANEHRDQKKEKQWSAPRFSKTPSYSLQRNTSLFQDTRKDELFLGEPLAVNFRDMPLPAFINHIFGDILNASFQVSAELQEKDDLVTLRTKANITPTELYYLVTEVLTQYGVQVTFQDEYFNIAVAEKTTSEVPLLISGRALPEVPVSHRPVFLQIQPRVVTNVMLSQWLRVAFLDQKLEVFDDPLRGGILLKGKYELVKMAEQMVQVLDQPSMRGRHSLRVDPMFLSAETLARQLKKVLQAEGITAGEKNTPVVLIPIKEIDALLLFCADGEMLQHVREWIDSLDKSPSSQGAQSGGKGFFSYQVRHTTAESIATVLNQMMIGGLKDEGKSVDGKKQKIVVHSPTSSVIVDSVRNNLLFQGSSIVWNQMQPIIRSMDKPDRMVLLEVIIAEIRLDDGEELGINWTVTKQDAKFGTGPLGRGGGGLPLGANGFSFILDTAGEIFARFNAFAEKNKISVLSTPRLLVKNGTSASIEVGSEVPFLARAVSSSNISNDNTTGIVSETQYRKTGILLSVEPTIFSGNRVEIQISQEASETKPDDTNSTSSPTIFKRKIETTLTLDDGASVLLGGLITSSHSTKQQGVPFFSDLPFLGGLFRVSGGSADRTELVMMIIPYIIDSDSEAQALTDAYLQRLSYGRNQD